MVKSLRSLLPLLVVVMLGFCVVASAQNPDVTITGIIQGPNGLPAANQIISLQPTQSFFVAGLGSASCNSYIVEINGTALSCADTINFNATTPAAPTNGINVTFATSKSGTTDSVSAAVVGNGNAATCLSGIGTYVNCVGGLTALYPIAAVYAGAASGSLNVTGVYAAGGAILAEASNNFPTTTLPWSYTFTSSSSASTSTVIGYDSFESGSNSVLPILGFYRFSSIFSIGTLSGARYWAGLGNWNNGSGTGVNSVQIINTTAYAADLPNKTTLGFRFSEGVDTHWQAASLVANNSGVLSTLVDTGITPDTNVHLFEMAPNSTGTSITYYIDGVSVATISTNLPNPSAQYDALGSPFLTGDNKNTATAVSATFYQSWLSLK